MRISHKSSKDHNHVSDIKVCLEGTLNCPLKSETNLRSALVLLAVVKITISNLTFPYTIVRFINRQRMEAVGNFGHEWENSYAHKVALLESTVYDLKSVRNPSNPKRTTHRRNLDFIELKNLQVA